MTALTTNLRKAAILLRSVDADTATTLLAQLSPAEAEAIRKAIQTLGSIDADERADVAAEFRRVNSVAAEDPRHSVELDFSTTAEADPSTWAPTNAPNKPFEFLEQARVESLVPYLAREHGQTVAVVLSHLPPARAAEVLAALPAQLQCETMERLSTLGETDPDSLEVLERELAEWVARRQATRSRETRRPDAVTAILAAADDRARSRILANLRKVNRALADEMAPAFEVAPTPTEAPQTATVPSKREPPVEKLSTSRIPQPQPIAQPQPRKPVPQIDFEDLARIDSVLLADLLKTVDAEIWALALAAASDAVVDRVAAEMPRRTAKAFRRRLRQLGPTRLRDVETAQREVIAVASEMIAQRAHRRAAHAALAS